MRPKPYIELSDFPSLTPFSVPAIQAYMQRGELREGVHYFRAPSRGNRPGRPIFKWSAIEEWIEQRSRLAGDGRDIVPVRRRA